MLLVYIFGLLILAVVAMVIKARHKTLSKRQEIRRKREFQRTRAVTSAFRY
jgi:hypothetical protein